MYTFVLALHSWLRWVALIAGIAATFTTLSDRSASTAQGRADMWGLVLMMTLDIQMLLGLLLYLVLSPFTAEAMRDFGAAMRSPGLRFFAVEHVTLMFLAVILVHVGRVLARKAKTADSKRMRLMTCFGFATIAMVLAIPWPGMASGRPLFRL
jgi:cytochrome c biogenesis factor